MLNNIPGLNKILPQAVFGPITFKLLTSFTDFNKQSTFRYAEHAVLEGKPKLQYMGENLISLDLKFHFHKGFCNPTLEYTKLLAVAKGHTPLPLTFGNGLYQGLFVVESIGQAIKQTDADGTIFEMTVDVKLKEWSANIDVYGINIL